MPGVYEKFGIRFLYPENWEIVDEQTEEWPRAVTVQSPGGAFLTIHVYEGGVNLRQLAREAADALQSEYTDSECEELLTCNDADYGFNLHFYYLDLIVQAEIRGVLLPGKALLWLLQAESREFDELEQVFRAILLSLLGKIPTPEA